MTRLMKALSSARLAAWLIGILLAFLLVSFLVPQRGIYPAEQVEAFLAALPGLVAGMVQVLELDHVFTSVLFYIVAVVLAVNLVVCTWRRAMVRIRRGSPSSAGPVPDTAALWSVADRAAAEEALVAAGARAISVSEAEAQYYLRRGDMGFAGSIVLHVALVLILIGGVWSGLTTFQGEMLLTEGQSRSDVPDEYLSISKVPSLGTAFRDFGVTLESMDFVYEDGSVIDAVAQMRVTEREGVRSEQAKVNYPLKVKGKSFLLQDAGHSVWIVVRDASGAPLFDSFVNLLSATDAGYEDSLQVGGRELRVLSRPDSTRPLAEPVRNGLNLVAPVVGLSLEPAASMDDYTWVAPGGSVAQLGDYTVSVNEVRRWNRFLVRADGGRYLIYAAFLLIILGTLVRFLDVDRWFKAVVATHGERCTVSLWGARRYQLRGLPSEGLRVARVLDKLADTEPGAAHSAADADTMPRSEEVERW